MRYLRQKGLVEFGEDPYSNIAQNIALIFPRSSFNEEISSNKTSKWKMKMKIIMACIMLSFWNYLMEKKIVVSKKIDLSNVFFP